MNNRITFLSLLAKTLALGITGSALGGTTNQVPSMDQGTLSSSLRMWRHVVTAFLIRGAVRGLGNPKAVKQDFRAWKEHPTSTVI